MTTQTPPAPVRNVYGCVDGDFEGACMLWHAKSNTCVTLPPNFNKALSSFGPDAGQKCFIFMETGCSGSTTGPIQYPGVNDLEGIGWNDAISSFKCNSI
ncbi:hypothetical protein B0H14DRAFT_3424196 [Mycena olivaceomarginata]|nr:hypothetical protein B0H14DRAFT_3424196 [Mycena olivaceomarginata]